MSGDTHEIRGWLMYDWANSAFETTVVTVLAGPYLTALAQNAAGENGTILDLGPLGAVTAKSLFPYAISLSVVGQVVLLPLLGVLADYTHLKKHLMAVCCYAGATATCLLFFIRGDRYLVGASLLVMANVAFGASIVFYNSYLNDLATEDERDRLSSRGYAFGYVGGGLLLAANLGLIMRAQALGISRELAVRVSLLSAGLWWGGFGVFTFRRLKARAPAKAPPPGVSYARIAVRELAHTFGALKRLPNTLQYLVAYMGYNDGIQTVITIASLFLSQELFVAKGLPVDEGFLVEVILMVQFVAFAGAMLFERIAAWTGTKNAILISLSVWAGVILYAYAALQTTAEAWGLGIVIALVLGGSQALSRSLFSQMIPRGREASFFGLYEIAESGTSWIGPFLFGLVASITNSYRRAILSLIGLFAVGITLLLVTDTRRAMIDARHSADAIR